MVWSVPKTLRNPIKATTEHLKVNAKQTTEEMLDELASMEILRIFFENPESKTERVEVTLWESC